MLMNSSVLYLILCKIIDNKFEEIISNFLYFETDIFKKISLRFAPQGIFT